VSAILILLSENIPDALFMCLSDLLGIFDLKAYQLWNALVNILGNFVMKKLSWLDEIEDAETWVRYQTQKEKMLLALLKWIHDEASYARKEVI